MEGHHLPAGIAEAGQVRVIRIQSGGVNLMAGMHEIIKLGVRHVCEAEIRISPGGEFGEPGQRQVARAADADAGTAVGCRNAR